MSRRGVKKHHRDQAILILRIAASDPTSGTYLDIVVELGWNDGAFYLDNPAIMLALEAWYAAFKLVPDDAKDCSQVRDALAAELLAEGWMPGTPTLMVDS